MNADELPGPTRLRARIEIIPLIDVIFFLLATFVLFTLSLSKIAAIGIPFPAGEIAPREDTTVYLQASEAGTCFWKIGRSGAPEMVPQNELAPRLADHLRRVPNARVLVRGDAKARYGDAVRLVDEVRKSGIKQVSLETLVSASGS